VSLVDYIVITLVSMFVYPRIKNLQHIFTLYKQLKLRIVLKKLF